MSQSIPRLIDESAPIASRLTGRCVFSVDVEDWFHILDVPSTPHLETWDSLPSVVERNFLRLLDLFELSNVRVSCFFLGWIARRYPKLVTEAARRGHEIASHGYGHRLVFEMTEREFREDALLARRVLEDVAGCEITGYRSAGFSATEKTTWFFRALVEAGHQYDSSVFPASRQHGGMASANRAPHIIQTDSGPLAEFPISVVDALGRPLCFFGGGYLRLFPYSLIRRMGRRVIREGRPIVFYVHPREIDPAHPRLPMPAHRRFRSYTNLHTTESKIRRLLSEFSFVTFREFMNQWDAWPEAEGRVRLGEAR
jgi:polysaccharide deacetylase family protein (PEP-CTERM system associated)